MRGSAAASSSGGAAGKASLNLFQFDRVFGSDSTQATVFADVAPFMQSCVDGYNVCIFAYGQTGSGKTYTMEGPAANPGVNFRALDLLFRLIGDRSMQFDSSVTVSVVEIYNETPKDLLAKKQKDADKLDIRVGDQGVYIPDLTEIRVQQADQVMSILRTQAYPNRAVGHTSMNETSSRSHCLLFVNVQSTNRTTSEITNSKLVLVDLAGSERVGRTDAEGVRLKEAQAINKSLSALGNVIAALKTHQAHVPFRDSKLTFLLTDCLSGNSKSLMFCNVSPEDIDRNESLCSLKFAERVRACELGPTTKAGASAAELTKMKTAALQSKDEVKATKQQADALAKQLAQHEESNKAAQDKLSSATTKLKDKERELKEAEDEKSSLMAQLKHWQAEADKFAKASAAAEKKATDAAAAAAAALSAVSNGSSAQRVRALNVSFVFYSQTTVLLCVNVWGRWPVAMPVAPAPVQSTNAAVSSNKRAASTVPALSTETATSSAPVTGTARSNFFTPLVANSTSATLARKTTVPPALDVTVRDRSVWMFCRSFVFASLGR